MFKEGKQGKRRVIFVDVAHFVMGAFWAYCGVSNACFSNHPPGRKRYNILGAYSVKRTQLINLTNDAYINSDSLVELLDTINRLHPDTPGQCALSALR